MLTSIGVKFIVNSAPLGLFSSANFLQVADGALRELCLLAVLAMFLAIILPTSYS